MGILASALKDSEQRNVGVTAARCGEDLAFRSDWKEERKGGSKCERGG